MKRLLKAILWIVCYGGSCWFVFKSKLGFDILSGKHWTLLFDKSVHSHWPTTIADKKLVCRILLAFIVVGILGLAVITKRKKSLIPVVKGELPDKEGFRPTPMISQGKMMIAVPDPTPNSNPDSAPVLGESSALSQPVLNTQPINLMGDAVRKITDIANTFEVSVFPHVKLENTFTQLVISDDATAMLLKVLPQTGTWKVEQGIVIEESLWTLGNEQPKKILKDIVESTSTLARLEPEAHAISVILITGGDIENAGAVRSYLRQNGIRIATLDNQNMPDIPTWHELLSEFYIPKQEEEDDNETDENL